MLRYALFAKALALSARERLAVTGAEISAALSVDAERVWHCIQFGHWVPLQVSVVGLVLASLAWQVGAPLHGTDFLKMP